MTSTFLGIPIEGEIWRGDRVPQLPLEALAPLLQAVLDDETITRFGWSQFTPRYDDGDICLFRASDFWARTINDVDEADRADEDDSWKFPLVGHPTLNSDVPGFDRERLRRCWDLEKAIHSGKFNDVLLEAFGDCAAVTVQRSGIAVEFLDIE